MESSATCFPMGALLYCEPLSWLWSQISGWPADRVWTNWHLHSKQNGWKGCLSTKIQLYLGGFDWKKNSDCFERSSWARKGLMPRKEVNKWIDLNLLVCLLPFSTLTLENYEFPLAYVPYISIFTFKYNIKNTFYHGSWIPYSASIYRKSIWPTALFRWMTEFYNSHFDSFIYV